MNTSEKICLYCERSSSQVRLQEDIIQKGCVYYHLKPFGETNKTLSEIMADQDISKLRVIDLKRELRIRGLKVTGNKNELATRLQSAMGSHIKESNYQNKRAAKKRKLIHGSIEQSSVIFKMPVEIIEYIFDYLNLKDLSAVSATCKQMQQIAGRVYQQNYSGLCPSFSQSKGNWIVRRSKDDSDIDIQYFIPFIDKMLCAHKGFLLDPEPKFDQLKKLTLKQVELRTVEIHEMKGILSKLEHLQLIYCYMDKSFLKNLLVRTPNLKRVYLLAIDDGQSYLKCSYPTLECFDICSYRTIPFPKFLALNPNIRRFGIDAKNLWKNRKKINAADVKLEDLTIYIKRFPESQIKQDSFWQLLNEYRQLGVYKRLNLFMSYELEEDFVDRIPNTIRVNRLTVNRIAFSYSVALSNLTHLEDITHNKSNIITDIEDVAKLENLKFIHFGVSNTNHLKLFMGKNAKLERLRIDWFQDEAGNIEYEKIINLIGLNKDRARLTNASKVTLFVQEPVYLATKRAKREIDLDFIKLKRTDTLSTDDKEIDFPRKDTTLLRCLYILKRLN